MGLPLLPAAGAHTSLGGLAGLGAEVGICLPITFRMTSLAALLSDSASELY